MKQKTQSFYKLLINLLLLCSGVAILSSCATPLKIYSDECRGFPFDKKFPSVDNTPLGVLYDTDYPWAIGMDGIRYNIYADDLIYPYNQTLFKDRKTRFYNVFDLPHSERENKYLEEYRKREEAFDKKYAGWIKKKLLATAKWEAYDGETDKLQVINQAEFNRKWLAKAKAGKFRKLHVPHRKSGWGIIFNYQEYLVGDKLPEGLRTPASFFSPDFLSLYPFGVNSREPLQDDHGDLYLNHALSLRLMPGYKYRYGVGRMSFEGSRILRTRMKAVFVEYILTYYYLKDYSSTGEREQTGRDLAWYYSDIAFRAMAEGGFVARRFVTDTERCVLANFIAKRLYDYILTAFTDPKQFKKIRQEYEYEITHICYSKIESIRLKMSNECFKDEKCRNAQQEKNMELSRQIEWNEERCVND